MKISHQFLRRARVAASIAGHGLNLLAEVRQANSPLALALAGIRGAGFLLDYYDPEDALIQEFSRWQGKPGDLIVSSDPENHYVLSPWRDPPDYVGEPDPDDLVKTLRILPPEQRSLLCIGPSGTGKTTTAQIVAHKLRPNERVVALAASSFRSDANMLPELFRKLKKSLDVGAIILDDVTTDELHMGQMLPALESACNMGIFPVITVMRDTFSYVEKKRPGMLYYPGMRPGRLGLVVPFFYPKAEQRRKVLAHYLGYVPDAELVRRTDCLTQAYLMDLARRIKAGVDPEEAIEQLRLIAPLDRDPPRLRRYRKPRPTAKKKLVAVSGEAS